MCRKIKKFVIWKLNRLIIILPLFRRGRLEFYMIMPPLYIKSNLFGNKALYLYTELFKLLII